uniref:Ig-like domain-containing protein n=1 Tax=Chitinimonas sp. TaxID=1934313 RepID=UPI0035AF3978
MHQRIEPGAMPAPRIRAVWLKLATLALSGFVWAAPQVSVSAPLAGKQYDTSPISDTLQATATADSGKTISSVVFHWVNSAKVDTTLTGTVSANGSVYSLPINLAGKPAGNYEIYAVATDSAKAKVSSARVTVVVGNTAPTASLRTNAPAIRIKPGVATGAVVLNGSGNDSNGRVAKLELLVNPNNTGYGTTPVKTLTGTAASLALSNYSYAAAPGSSRFKLRVTDDQGLQTESDEVSATVSIDQPPTASLSQPAAARSYGVANASSQASVVISGSGSDADGSVSKLELLDNGKVIASANSASLTSTVALAVGNHSLVLRATDDTGVTGNSNALAITVVVETAPTVQLRTPASNSTVIAKANGLASVAIDGSGSSAAGLSNLELLDGSTVLASSASGSLNQTVDLPVGQHRLSLRATNQLNAQTSSTPITLTVVANQAPSISWTSPAADSRQVTAEGSYRTAIVATASDTDGGVSLLELLDGETVIASATNGKLDTQVSLTTGSHALRLRATDDLGAKTLSDPRTITVVVNQAPSLSWTSPAADSRQVTAEGSYRAAIVATASDTDGSVSLLELLDGDAVIASATNGKLDTQVSLTTGSHPLRLRATDDQGAKTLSDPRTITVLDNQLPDVSLQTPATDISVTTAPGNSYPQDLAGSASDSDGKVVRLELLDGGMVVADWASDRVNAVVNLGEGAHTLRLRATDNLGGQATSAARQVTVVAGQTPQLSLAAPATDLTVAASGGVYQASIDATATSRNPGKSIKTLQLLDGDQVIAQSQNGTLKTSVALPPGEHALSLRAEDEMGMVSLSPARRITVTASAGQLAVRFVSPSGYTLVDLDAKPCMAVIADASSAAGTIRKVELLDNGIPVPWTFWAGDNRNFEFCFKQVGLHSLVLRATDSAGTVGDSEIQNVNVYAFATHTFGQILAPATDLNVVVAPGAVFSTQLIAVRPTNGDRHLNLFDNGILLASASNGEMRITLNLGIGQHRLLVASSADPSAAMMRTITVTTAPTGQKQGMLEGIIRKDDKKAYVIGWACTVGKPEPERVWKYFIPGIEMPSLSRMADEPLTDPRVAARAQTACGNDAPHGFSWALTDLLGITEEGETQGRLIQLNLMDDRGIATQLACNGSCLSPGQITVGITSPKEGDTLTAQSRTYVVVRATDADAKPLDADEVESVDLLVNGRYQTTLARDTIQGPTAYGGFFVPDAEQGSAIDLVARLTMKDGRQLLSGAIHLTVTGGSPVASLRWISPAAGSKLDAPARLRLQVRGAASTGNTVKFFQNDQPVDGVVSVTEHDDNGRVLKDFMLDWTGVAAGSYGLTARLYDAGGALLYTTPVQTVTVAPTQAGGTQIYYVYADPLNTPRLLTDSGNNVVWQNSPFGEPYGNTPVQAQNGFEYNLRFPG